MSENGQSPADKIADTAGKVLETVRHAIEEGIESIRPTWEEKVAPAVASGAEKVAEWGESARESADRKAAEYKAEDQQSSKILSGALGVGAAAAALGTTAVRAVGKAAAEAAEHGAAAKATEAADAETPSSDDAVTTEPTSGADPADDSQEPKPGGSGAW